MISAKILNKKLAFVVRKSGTVINKSVKNALVREYQILVLISASDKLSYILQASAVVFTTVTNKLEWVGCEPFIESRGVVELDL